MLQNTARRAVRSRIVAAEAGGEVDADRQDGEVDGAGGHEHEADRLDRPPPVRGPAHGQGEAGRARRRPAAAASQPASDDSRIVVSIGVLWDTPTATSRAASGSDSANCGLTSGEALLDDLRRRRRRPPAGGSDGPRRPPSAAPGPRRGTRPGRRRSPRGRRRSASTTGRTGTVNWAVVDCCSSSSAICSATASRTAGSLSMSVVTSANPWELANVRQLHSDDHRQVEQQHAHQEQRSRPAAEHAEPTPSLARHRANCRRSVGPLRRGRPARRQSAPRPSVRSTFSRRCGRTTAAGPAAGPRWRRAPPGARSARYSASEPRPPDVAEAPAGHELAQDGQRHADRGERVVDQQRAAVGDAPRPSRGCRRGPGA